MSIVKLYFIHTNTQTLCGNNIYKKTMIQNLFNSFQIPFDELTEEEKKRVEEARKKEEEERAREAKELGLLYALDFLTKLGYRKQTAYYFKTLIDLTFLIQIPPLCNISQKFKTLI